MAQANCPICTNLFIGSERYPKSICGSCRQTIIRDLDGHRVTFQNIDAFGGFESIHVGEGNQITKKEEHLCFVNGVKCWADEGRYGGIIIQVMESAN